MGGPATEEEKRQKVLDMMHAAQLKGEFDFISVYAPTVRQLTLIKLTQNKTTHQIIARLVEEEYKRIEGTSDFLKMVDSQREIHGTLDKALMFWYELRAGEAHNDNDEDGREESPEEGG